MPTSRQIRQEYIDFFVKKHGHTFVPSSPVVPHEDPTLLFTNAGMNQFKPYFLGTQQAPWPRVANTQKCIRAGGKHNDLDDVGRSRRHHTFFEMLGNWSFGNYFKKGAIEMAWELLTQVWKLDPARLHVTCFEGDEKNGVPRDTEAADIWHKVCGVPLDHIHYFGKDNFWEMGDTGPCGPCTEIYIDRTPGKTGGKDVNGEDPRVMEIWNLVFIQFNRNPDRTLTTLPSQHVDTGMGLERVCQVIQDKQDNYGTDLWTPIFDKIAELSGHKYSGQFPATNVADPAAEAANPQLRTDIAFRVIADHVRCLTFALTDGAVPSNEGRGYVLRRILRRAVRFGRQQLGLKKPFMHELVAVVADAMGDTFPELRKDPKRVSGLIHEEEESFGRTIDRGIDLATASFEWRRQITVDQTAYAPNSQAIMLRLLRQVWLDRNKNPLAKLSPEETAKYGFWIERDCREAVQFETQTGVQISPESLIKLKSTQDLFIAEVAFKLHDTYGFPLDLTQVMAQERGMTVDVAGFEALMEKAKDQSRGDAGDADETKARESLVNIVQRDNPPATKFLGYEKQEARVSGFSLLYRLEGPEYKAIQHATAGEKLAIILPETVFYAESGGQVGDVGAITNTGGGVFRVTDTVKIGDTFFHLGVVERGPFLETKVGGSQTLDMLIDTDRRAKIMANHTTTHVMNRALRLHVSKTADQRGSLVDDQKLRFDFAHNAAVTAEQIEQVEKSVNDDISKDLPVYTDYAPQEQALKIHGLRAVFGEKYPPKVRVVSIGVPVKDLLSKQDNPDWPNYSIEFCGGTHLAKTGDAEGFVIVQEEAVGKGVRRITALTGSTAHAAAAKGDMLLSRMASLKNSPPAELAVRLNELTTEIAAATLPATARAKLRDGMAELQKAVKEFEKSKSKEAAGDAVEAARKLAETLDGVVIVAEVPGADADGLRTAMDVIRKKKPDSALLLGAVAGDKVSFVAAVPDALIKKGLKAGDWVKEAAKVAGGGGGGRPDMAQAGGKDPAKLQDALEAARKFAAKLA